MPCRKRPDRIRSMKTIEFLAPIGGTIKGQGIQLSDTTLWPFHSLAALLPSANVEAVNRALSNIYLQGLLAEWAERQPTRKDAQRGLRMFRTAVLKVEQSVGELLAAQLRIALREFRVPVPPEVSDTELWVALTAAMLRAPGSIPPRPRGSRGLGARARKALILLVDLYQHETGSGKPYRGDDKAWRHLEAFQFAHSVLEAWGMTRASDGPVSLAGVWERAVKQSGQQVP